MLPHAARFWQIELAAMYYRASSIHLLNSKERARMQYRELGRTGYRVSTVSFGAWAIGSAWGAVDDSDSLAALHHAVDLGVNFFDTADVYGDGHSEQLLARLKRERPELKDKIIIATKVGRRLNPHVADGYNA